MSKHYTRNLKIKRELPFFVVCVILIRITNGKCPFPITNETLQNVCDWSKWLPWNCTCCGTDVTVMRYAERKRGICCNVSQPLNDCLVKCGFNVSDSTEYETCGFACPHITYTSPCLLPTPHTVNNRRTTQSVQLTNHANNGHLQSQTTNSNSVIHTGGTTYPSVSSAHTQWTGVNNNTNASMGIATNSYASKSTIIHTDGTSLHTNNGHLHSLHTGGTTPPSVSSAHTQWSGVNNNTNASMGIATISNASRSTNVIAIVTGSVFGSLLAICGPLCLIGFLWKRKKDKQKKVGPVNEPQTGPPSSIPNNEYTGVTAIRHFCVAACSPVCLILKRLKDKKKQTEPAADPVTSHGSITDNSLVEKDVEVVDETQET